MSIFVSIWRYFRLSHVDIAEITRFSLRAIIEIFRYLPCTLKSLYLTTLYHYSSGSNICNCWNVCFRLTYCQFTHIFCLHQLYVKLHSLVGLKSWTLLSEMSSFVIISHNLIMSLLHLVHLQQIHSIQHLGYFHNFIKVLRLSCFASNVVNFYKPDNYTTYTLYRINNL